MRLGMDPPDSDALFDDYEANQSGPVVDTYEDRIALVMTGAG